jgi:hypothetical protein
MRPSSLVNAITGRSGVSSDISDAGRNRKTSWLQARLKDVARVLDGPERHRQRRLTIVLCVQIKGGFVVSWSVLKETGQ